MGDALKEWTLVVSAVVVFGSICEIILPEGSFQKYTRFVIGLILISALATPIYSLLKLKPNMGNLIDEKAELYTDYTRMEETEGKTVIRIYKKKMEQKMLWSLQENVSKDIIDVDCDINDSKENFGNIKRVRVYVGTESKSLSDRIYRCIRDYGVEENLVYIDLSKEKM